MENTHPLCIICGTRIPYRNSRHTWQREFRAVRCDNNSGFDGKPFLTGLGGYISPQITDCEAPSNPESQWNDPNYQWSSNDRFPPLIGNWARPQPGFLFHEACWKLLQRMIYPTTVSVEYLYDICLSFPANVGGWLDWGHRYGGLMDQLPYNGYPFEDLYIVGFVKRYLGDKDSPLTYAMCDPSDVPELDQALLDTRERQGSVSEDEAKSISPIFRGATDCFRKLPQEVLEYIQMLLPSAAVVNARTASRSFTSLRLDQSFWASRFNRHHERGYCIEARLPLYGHTIDKRKQDWKALYNLTTVTPTSSNELKNRKRIVDCSQDLVEILQEDPCIDKTTFTKNLQILHEEKQDTTWRTIGGDSASRPEPHRFPSGIRCRRMYEQVIDLPYSPIKTIAATFRGFSGRHYISGLRFAFGDDSETLMGYVVPGKEKYLSLNDPGFHLTGFITAVGARGIMALRAVSNKGEVSDWIGTATGLPQSLRLCMKNRIETLKGNFDGLKLITLAVPKSMTPLFPGNDLRTSALWYPTIPSPFQNLHDDYFPARQVSPTEYRPLVHVMFGGPGGILLKHLVRISVTVSKSEIVGINFFYDVPVATCTTSGYTSAMTSIPENKGAINCGHEHGHVYSHSLQACPSTASSDTSDKILFAINGPAGERLTSIQGEGDFFLGAAGQGTFKYGVITALKVTTNFNRSFTFQPSALPVFKLPVGPHMRQKAKRGLIARDSTLTGIYFMHDATYGMVSIGPISEEPRKMDLSSRLNTGIEDEIRKQMGLC